MEYKKHLKDEPSDTNARLKVGDLQLKRGDRPAAIEAYTQVAAQFSKSGFDAKAVAIYKQILRIDPNYLAARRELGDHFQRMGLASDALREFQEAVRICQERGLKRDAFDLLKRVATLDPTNIPNRLSLADLLIREKLADEARDEFASLLDEVSGRSEWEDAARVAARFVEQFPDEERAIAGLARAKVQMNEIPAAIQVLKGALGRFPESLELREALGAACDRAGDTAGKARAYKEIAEVYKQRGDLEKAREILQLHVPMQSFGGDDEDDDGPPSLVLEEAATDVSLGTPGDIDLGGAELDGDDGIELVATDEVPPTLVAPRGEIELDLESLAEPGAEPMSTDELLAEARVSLEFDDRENAAKLARRVLEIEPNSSIAKKILKDATGTKQTARPEPAAKPAAKQAGSDNAEDLLFDALPDIELVLEDEEDDEDEYASIEPPTQVDLSAPVPGLGLSDDEEEFEIEIDDDEGSGGSASWEQQSAFVVERLEAADALFQQGQVEAAEAEYLKVLKRAPHHPQALLRLGEIAEQRGADPGEVPVPISAEALGDTHIEEDLEPPRPRRRKKARAAEPLELEPELLDADEAMVIDDEPEAEPERLMEAKDILDLEELEAEDIPVEPDFDLAAALDDEPGTSDGTGFDEVFKAFKRGIQQQVGDDEAGTHYDLAIAYKEMGLLDDACEQLEFVRRSDAHRIDGLSLLATCKIEMGRPQQAAGHLAEALAAADEGDECVVPLRYDMGEALLAAGKRGEALDAFRKVAAGDSGFREVRERIADLEGN